MDIVLRNGKISDEDTVDAGVQSCIQHIEAKREEGENTNSNLFDLINNVVTKHDANSSKHLQNIFL